MRLKKQKTISRIRTLGLVILTIALTFLSLKAQYNFWKNLFDVETAIIASSVFELLRLSSLFSILRGAGSNKTLGIGVYIGIALFCGSIAVTSWYSEIIETQTMQQEQVYQQNQERIIRIKSTYAENIQEKLSKIEKDLYFIDSKIAANTKSLYWTNRKVQILNTKKELIKQRDNFLSEIPKNTQIWIEKNSAILGLDVESLENKQTPYTAIENAISNTWKLTAEQAQKIVAMIFVIFIEIGIVLLALMTEVDKIGNRKNKLQTLINTLDNHFNTDDIRMLLLRCNEKILKTGKLPKSSELTLKLRPVRKEIMNMHLDNENLKDLYYHYCD